jgi:hypothetical protein
VCILDTSSIPVSGSEGLTAFSEEVDHLIHLGDELILGLVDARILLIFRGARPL